jgi:hypothetical protein
MEVGIWLMCDFQHLAKTLICQVSVSLVCTARWMSVFTKLECLLSSHCYPNLPFHKSDSSAANVKHDPLC